jgi:hypothetical protein
MDVNAISCQRSENTSASPKMIATTKDNLFIAIVEELLLAALDG